MCDGPCTAVFCSVRVSIECFLATAFKMFFKLFVTIPVPPITTGIILLLLLLLLLLLI